MLTIVSAKINFSNSPITDRFEVKLWIFTFRTLGTNGLNEIIYSKANQDL